MHFFDLETGDQRRERWCGKRVKLPLSLFILIILLLLGLAGSFAWALATRTGTEAADASPCAASSDVSQIIKATTTQTFLDAILTNVDESIKPCDDFYLHTCSRWQKAHPATQYPSGSESNLISILYEKISQQELTLLRGNYPFVETLYQQCTAQPDEQSLPQLVLDAVTAIQAAENIDELIALQVQGLIDTNFLFGAQVGVPSSGLNSTWRAAVYPGSDACQVKSAMLLATWSTTGRGHSRLCELNTKSKCCRE
jgi:hypothetical protein